MKRVIVTREKKFAGALVPFWIVAAELVDRFPSRFQQIGDVQLDGTAFPRPTLPAEALAEVGAPVKNGESVTVELADDITAIYAVTMDGILSNRAALAHGVTVGDAETFRFTVTAKGGFARPCYPQLTEDEV